MTTWKIGGQTYQLNRDAVLANRCDSLRRAEIARLGGSSIDREFFTASEIRGQVDHWLADARRFQKIIDAIDAGVAELPTELYPQGIR